MIKYVYKGKETVHIPYLGTFEPGKVYEVERGINHPDFERVNVEAKSEKSVKSRKK